MTDTTEAPEAKRKEVVGGSVNELEKQLIQDAGEKLGHATTSAYVRSVMLDHAMRALGKDRRKAS